MASASKLWGRMQEELRSVSERTRRGATRAVRSGVLQLDLVSLRRDRNRAHADLGARVLSLWSAGGLETLPADFEAARLRALVQSIDESIGAKEEELRTLRTRASDADSSH